MTSIIEKWLVQALRLTAGPCLLFALALSAASERDFSVNLGRGIQLDMVWINGGTFQMGSPSGEGGRDTDEGPLHSVQLDGFWMGKYEVTNGQYRRFLEETQYDGCADADSDYLEHFHGRSTAPTGPDYPVVWVTWKNGMAFCNWLSAKTGHIYSLPSEAQWEYTCRGSRRSRFSFGDSEDELADYGWFASNSSGLPHRVGQKRPNGFGLFDMHGNVWEACLDWYSPEAYRTALTRNPAGPTAGEYRVFRGGCWYSRAAFCRSANRIWDEPGNAQVYFGFRVVQLADEASR
jgi:formylglycine-generating enzyme required for sulfatase activity